MRANTATVTHTVSEERAVHQDLSDLTMSPRSTMVSQVCRNIVMSVLQR